MMRWLRDIASEIVTGLLIFIISLIVGWEKKEGLMILGIAIIIPLLKIGILIATESRYKELEDKIDKAVDNVCKRAFVLQIDNILTNIKSSLLKQYLEQEVSSLEEKIHRSLNDEELTELSANELYRMIRFMTENNETRTICSLDLLISRWTGIFSKEDYIEIGYSGEAAEMQVKDNAESKWLNETTILYEVNKNRLINPSDSLMIKRIFGISRDDINNSEYIKVLEKMEELEKEVGSKKIQTKVLIREELKPDFKEVYDHLQDIVIFNEKIVFRELPTHERGHRAILRPEDINRYKEDFFKLWRQKNIAIPITKFLMSLRQEDTYEN